MLRMIALCALLLAKVGPAYPQEDAKPPYDLAPQTMFVTACATQAETEQYVRVFFGAINWNRNVASVDKLPKKTAHSTCKRAWVQAVLGTTMSEMLDKNSMGIYFITEIHVVAEEDPKTGAWIFLPQPQTLYWSNFLQALVI